MFWYLVVTTSTGLSLNDCLMKDPDSLDSSVSRWELYTGWSSGVEAPQAPTKYSPASESSYTVGQNEINFLEKL